MIHNGDAKCLLMLLAADWERHHRNLNPKLLKGASVVPSPPTRNITGFPRSPLWICFRTLVTTPFISGEYHILQTQGLTSSNIKRSGFLCFRKSLMIVRVGGLIPTLKFADTVFPIPPPARKPVILRPLLFWRRGNSSWGFQSTVDRCKRFSIRVSSHATIAHQARRSFQHQEHLGS